MRAASFSAASTTSYSTYKDIELMDAAPDGPSQVGFATPQLLPTSLYIDQDMPIDDLFNSSNSLFINPQLLDNFEENFFFGEGSGPTNNGPPADNTHLKSYSSTTVDSVRNNSIQSTTNQSFHSFDGSISPSMKPPTTGVDEDFPWLDSIKAEIPDPINLNPSFVQNSGSPIQMLETLTGPLQSFQKQSQHNSPHPQQSPYDIQESFRQNSNPISPFFNDQNSNTSINNASINTTTNNPSSNASSEAYNNFNTGSNSNQGNSNNTFANTFNDTPNISTEMDFNNTLWDHDQTAMFPNNNRQNFQFEVKPHQITPTLRAHIISTLSTPTPFTSTQHPHLPSTPELQTYINAYITNFAPHLPFLHQTLEFTPENAPLALSMAAIGALHVFERTDSASIFEISRCCVHVYLESRRERKLDSKNSGQSEVTPLWLVQALLLGVVYGLFNDEPLANEIAVAQANAVISLAKSAGLHMPPRGFVSIPDANNSTIEDKWHYFVSVQERIRTMHVVHIVSCLLATGYNVVATLKNSDIRCGSPCDEDLWSAVTAQDWWNVLTKKESEGSLGNAIEGLDFADCLTRLISGNTLVGEIPQFTLLTLIYAIHLEIHERRLDYDRLNTQAISSFATDDQIRLEFNDHDGSASPSEIKEAKWLEMEKRRIEAMLRAWETTWSLSPHASLIPRNQEGSLMSDSIPMSSLAHVRLYLDLRKAKEYFWKRDFGSMGHELDILSAPVLYELQSGTRKQFNALLEAASYAADTISLWEKHSARWTLLTTASQTFIHNILALFDCGLIVSEFFNRLEKRGDANSWHEDEKQLVSRLRKIFFRVFDVLSSRYMDDNTDVLHNQQERVSTPSQLNGSSGGGNSNNGQDMFLQKDLQLPLSLMSLSAVSRILSTIYIWPFAVVMAQALKARMGQIREAKMRALY